LEKLTSSGVSFALTVAIACSSGAGLDEHRVDRLAGPDRADLHARFAGDDVDIRFVQPGAVVLEQHSLEAHREAGHQAVDSRDLQ
jgi:hypothetical protein